MMGFTYAKGKPSHTKPHVSHWNTYKPQHDWLHAHSKSLVNLLWLIEIDIQVYVDWPLVQK